MHICALFNHCKNNVLNITVSVAWYYYHAIPTVSILLLHCFRNYVRVFIACQNLTSYMLLTTLGSCEGCYVSMYEEFDHCKTTY